MGQLLSGMSKAPKMQQAHQALKQHVLLQQACCCLLSRGSPHMLCKLAAV